MKRSGPIKPRTAPRRNEGRVQHGRTRPKRGAPPDAGQAAYHKWLRGLGRCEACGATSGLVIHHILPSTRRSHWLVALICAGCHNGRSDSVHGLGSEAKFARQHGVDLRAVALQRRAQWSTEP